MLLSFVLLKTSFLLFCLERRGVARPHLLLAMMMLPARRAAVYLLYTYVYTYKKRIFPTERVSERERERERERAYIRVRRCWQQLLLPRIKAGSKITALTCLRAPHSLLLCVHSTFSRSHVWFPYSHTYTPTALHRRFTISDGERSPIQN